ncbi:two pore segment channel 3 [Notothenia coriiceps]|uniref:Two pore segment channel 3 n=1 Tax=Notothenia coriiceps TaxID=8208 RepID=A0A6I9NEM5_9TELE|nr:PREDICTED: two pore calcium channel protein 1-like [Notothenia coriiceps]
MSEPEKIEDIPDESAGKGKGIPNGGNAAKTKEDFDLAAIYVSDAQYNRNIYFDTSPEAVRLYLRYNHWLPQVLLYFFILLDLSLAVFEDPAVFPLPTWATMLVELLCLLVFTIRIVHYAKVIPREKFWKDPKNICIIVIIVLTLVDMIIYGALKATNYYGVRWSRVLRPLLLVNVTEGRQLRRAFRSIRNALPQIFYVFLLFMFSLLIFSLMALKLLGKRLTGKVAFVQLADLLNIEVITLKSRPHPLQSLCPSLYQSAPSRLLRKLVQHRAFVIVYDLIILVNAVFIGLDEKNPLIANSEWAFLALYLLEILLKLYVFEPRAFFSKHSFWNWFDTIIVISALIATIINSSMSVGTYTSRQILDIVFILRVLRLIRVVDSIKRFRTIINTLIRIGPAILTFGQLILVVYYVFAMVGMELFKHKVKFYEDSSDPAKAYCGNVLLKGTDFAQLNYCKNNFNNVVSSFILLVELTVVNQWHVLSSGFAAVTHGSAKLFFVFFHIIVVIVIINIFVAFVLEAFFVEYSVDKSDLQTSLEKKIEELELAVAQETLEDNLVNAMETIDSDQGTGQSANNKPTLMFKIASKRYRTVDALLQRMFESDLDPEDFAENDDQNGNFANPAFSAA